MTDRTLDEAILKTWIGRTEETEDLMDAKQARLMQATMDVVPDLSDGDALPPLWHWIYFPVSARLGDLGRDGHPKLGGFLPPVDLPRRMWAGGRFTFHTPVRIGERVVKTSTIADVAVKRGRTGPLCFVTVRHDFAGEGGASRFSEEHDIVYRDDPDPGATPPEPPEPPQNAVWSREVRPSPVMLFRYSALTFNGHRIHYDRDYCRDVEGYPGLVFHGPLTSALLADLAIEQMPGRIIREFSFRAMAPLFDDAPFVICGSPNESGNDEDRLEMWAQTPNGSLAMKASATFV